MRLSGWQRLGVVVSAVWFFAGGFAGDLLAVNKAQEVTELQLNQCAAENKTKIGADAAYDLVWTPCWNQFAGNYTKNVTDHWWVALAAAVIPIPFAWLFWAAILGTTRWVRRGFQEARRRQV